MASGGGGRHGVGVVVLNNEERWRKDNDQTTVSKNGAVTLPCINVTGYVRHAPIFSRMLTTAYCLIVGLGQG